MVVILVDFRAGRAPRRSGNILPICPDFRHSDQMACSQPNPPMNDIGLHTDDLQPLVEGLRSLLAEGALPAERKLAERLRVNRYRLRRALEALRATGEIAPRSGRRGMSSARRGEALVRGTNPTEVIEMRIMLEPALAR